MFYFWDSGNFLARRERFVESHVSDLEAIESAAFLNIFMKGATLFRIYPPISLKITKNPIQNTNKQHVRGRYILYQTR